MQSIAVKVAVPGCACARVLSFQEVSADSAATLTAAEERKEKVPCQSF